MAGWLENLILMKTQSSAQTWTWTLDFDLGFVNLNIFVVCQYGIFDCCFVPIGSSI